MYPRGFRDETSVGGLARMGRQSHEAESDLLKCTLHFDILLDMSAYFTLVLAIEVSYPN